MKFITQIIYNPKNNMKQEAFLKQYARASFSSIQIHQPQC